MEWLEPRNVFIAVTLIYAIILMERGWGTYYSESEELIQYREDKAELQGIIDNQNKQIYNYELNRIKRNYTIDSATNDQLDSLESVYYPR